MKESEYQVLPQHSDDALGLLSSWNTRESLPKSRVSMWSISLTILLVVSATINAFTFLYSPNRFSSGDDLFSAGYSGQQESNYIHIPHDNRTLKDEIWDSPRYNPYDGMIVVDDDFIREHNLPEAQRWPWDRSKSIYYMNAWHSLHCVQMLRHGVIAHSEGRSLPDWFNFGHLTHCLTVLRSDVECFADDLPLYTGAFGAEAEAKSQAKATAPGHGQPRKCRSWDKVRDFATSHSACFDAFKAGIAVPEINKYKFCPDGSKPWLKDQ